METPDQEVEAVVGVIRQHMLEGQVSATARHYEAAGKPYRPSTGTEGAAFQEEWCCHCARDAAFQADPDFAQGCQIVADTFAYDITDAHYPKEWIFDRDGRPCCTAYTEDPTCPRRCDKTLDLFASLNGQSRND